MRMRHIVICNLSASTTFLILSHKRHDFRKTVTGHKMCVLIFSTMPYEPFLVLRRTERDMIINVHGSSCTVPVILVRFQWNLSFLSRFSKKCSNMKFHGNPSSGSRVPCGRTDMKLTFDFRNFANAPIPEGCGTGWIHLALDRDKGREVGILWTR